MEDLLDAIMEILRGYDGDRIMIRHLCYRLESLRIVPKTEEAFGTVGKHLANWRFQGRIPFNCFIDSTRWYYGKRTFDDLEEALSDTVATYRKNLWREQRNLVEIWVEKEAVAGIVAPVGYSWESARSSAGALHRSRALGRPLRHSRQRSRRVRSP